MGKAVKTEGWHPDPERAGSERWWDGVDWTDHRRIVVSPGGRASAAREPVRTRLDEHTRWVSALVGSPVAVGLVYAAYSIGVLPLMLQTDAASRFTLKLGFLVVAGLVLAVVAVGDVRDLRARGFARVASPLWALATPIAYLAQRGRVIEQAGRAPLIIHLVLLVATVGTIALGVAFGMNHLAW